MCLCFLAINRKFIEMLIQFTNFLFFKESEISGIATVVSFMIPVTFSIFSPCYFGHELTVASLKLSNAMFESDWLKGDHNLTKNMKMFMENAKNEINFSAFGLFKANLETFTAIINAAYSLFALLRSINN